MTFKRQRRGQTQLTYAVILVLVAIAAIVAVMLFGRVVQGVLSDIHSKLDSVFPGTSATTEYESEPSEESGELERPLEPPERSPTKPPKKRPIKPPKKPPIEPPKILPENPDLTH